jgi:hypothetical protein
MAHMSRAEGVIKFQLDYVPGPPPAENQIAHLNGWRRILYLSKLIGQDASRYGGYGYGNLSCRLAPFKAKPNRRKFVISGSQTGHLPKLSPSHYAVVEAYDPDRYRVSATGPIEPSSESLTHGIIYDLMPSAQCVMHAHSPEIWHNADGLGIPVTSASATYGSPELITEIKGLLQDKPPPLFSMGGHQDGIVAFGTNVEEAGCLLVRALARALSG